MKSYIEQLCFSCGGDLERVLPHSPTCARRNDDPRAPADHLTRFALIPSDSYKWAVIAFNRGSGLDTTKTVRWYRTRKSAMESGRLRFGVSRHIIGRAPG